MITGFRRPRRSEIKPSKGQPINIQWERSPSAIRLRRSETVSFLEVTDPPNHVEDRGLDKEQPGDQPAQDGRGF